MYDIPPEAANRLYEIPPADASGDVQQSGCSNLGSVPKQTVRSLYPFRGETPDELSFDANCILKIHGYVNNEWAIGELDEKTGMFPISFVEFADVERPHNAVMGSARASFLEDDSVGIANVLFDFAGRESDELSVQAGECVSVMNFVNTDWAYCFDPGRNMSGIVPVSFLNIFLNDEVEEEEKDLAHEYVPSSNDRVGPLPASGHSLNTTHTSFAADWHQPKPALSTPILDSVEGDPLTTLNLDSFFGNIVRETGDFSKPKVPPPRPPPPNYIPENSQQAAAVIPATPTETSSELLKSSGNQSSSAVSGIKSLSDGGDAQARTRIIEDLIGSEIQYLSDISAWQAVIDGSSQISAEHKSVLTNGFPSLKELSRALLERITEEQGKPFEMQYFGLVFMKLRENFNKTFGFYFRNVDAITNIVEGKDRALLEVLSVCLIEMRALGSTIFDVPTAVSRPIHRCLKYPVFIAELIKTTPLSHVDHPKLLEAMKQMSELASKMNECKRRKELTEKYKNIEPESFAKRLSKINMHTVKKKSTRLKYRFTTQFGLVQLERDAEFDKLVEKLDACERRICKFLHALQYYKSFLISQTKRYLSTQSTEQKLGMSSYKVKTTIPLLCKCFLWRMANYTQHLDNAFGMEAKVILRLPVTRMMQKRYDKYLDYMSAKKEAKNLEELRKKQGDYEALNNQLKRKLPGLIKNINSRTINLVENILLDDRKYFEEAEKLLCTSEDLRAFFTISYSRFVDPRGQRLSSFERIGRLAAAANQLSADGKSWSSNKLGSHQNSSVSMLNGAETKQTAQFRLPRPAQHDPVLRKHDTWPVRNENLEASHEIDRTILNLFSETPGLFWAEKTNNSVVIPNQNSVSKPHVKNEGDLIDLDDYLLDLNKEAVAYPLSQSNNKASTGGASSHLAITRSELPSSTVSLEELLSITDISPATKERCLQSPVIPSRPTELQPCTTNSTMLLPSEASLHGSIPEDLNWHAAFDFSGTDIAQLSLFKNERIAVLKKCDDCGSQEWWLVKNAAGKIGYVPASYLSASP